MKIAHCISGLGIGGAQQVIKFLVAQRSSEALQHYVYSCEDGVFRGEVERAGAVVRIIPRRLPKLDPLWALALARAMRADGIDVVHTHLFGDSLHGYLAARVAGGLPVIMTLHCFADALPRLQRVGYHWLLPRCTRTIACSPSSERSFAEAARRRHAHLATIPNGISAPSTTPVLNGARVARRGRLGLSVDVAVIAAVGRLVEGKGFTHLIDAAARLANSGRDGFRVVIIGEGPLRAELEAHAVRAGVRHIVHFTGFRDDVGELLPVFDVIAFPSLAEGLCMALLESMAAGSCIVASDAPGLADALRHERDGLLVRPGDAAALSAALDRVLGDAALRTRLGRAAQQRFGAEFTAEHMVAQYEALYRDVCGAAPDAAPATFRRGDGER